MISQSIKVTVLCITYNQAMFIKQALDGFLMQDTDFDFEVLVNDDASSDGTVDILKEYQKKYPQIIKLTLQNENQYSKGRRNFMARYLLPKVRGEYIAICEGDDYWTDPTKLQRQVDFLDNHKDYSLCFHPVGVVFEGNQEKHSTFPDKRDRGSFTLERLLEGNYIQTNSVMYRKCLYKNLNLDVMPGDWYLHLYHAKFGKIGFINREMSVYRKHKGGLWWSAGTDRNTFWLQYGLRHIILYIELLEMFNDPKLHKIIMKNMQEAANSTMPLVESAVKENLELKSELEITKQRYEMIVNSKTWRLRNKIMNKLRSNG